MNRLNFEIGWFEDDHCTDVRGVATFDTNITRKEWHECEGEKPIEMENIKLEALEIPFKKLTANEDKWEWRKADPDEIDYLINHPEFYHELRDYWLENSDV